MPEISVQVCKIPTLEASMQNITITEAVIPHIGENGSWWIDGADTNVSAKGADGYTPVKGIDYFTEADKAEMVELVIAAIPKYDGSYTVE